MPAEHKESAGWVATRPADDLPKGDWRIRFEDSQLDALENKARRANQSLKARLARLEQARADTRIARADLFPSISATASAKRARVSPNSPTYVAGAPTEGKDFVLEADLFYEVDLWGRVRNQVAAARANQQASAADLASLELSIDAEVATDYFGLRSSSTRSRCWSVKILRSSKCRRALCRKRRHSPRSNLRCRRRFSSGAPMSRRRSGARSASWSDAPSIFWSIGPQITLPLFEGGRMVAQTARAKAAYEEQVATYRNTGLTAYQDVENNLAALRQLQTESETETQAIEATSIALQQSQDRYSAGIVTFLEIATTETAALQAQLSAINIRTRRLNASVLLIKARSVEVGASDQSPLERTSLEAPAASAPGPIEQPHTPIQTSAAAKQQQEDNYNNQQVYVSSLLHQKIGHRQRLRPELT
jgi:outer membrane protein TolC